jgi:NAD(P)-dependent dehydrogenase (short-subunit alcohol dehydrogenase family)
MSTSRYAEAHANPSGPGDARPTALDIVEDEGLVGKLSSKVILITGCSSGIGLETARALSATGAHVFITARDHVKGAAAKKELEASRSASDGIIDVLKLELDSLQSVRECAAAFLSKSKQLNIFVANAGKDLILLQ